METFICRFYIGQNANQNRVFLGNYNNYLYRWSLQLWAHFLCFKRPPLLTNSAVHFSTLHFNLGKPCTDLMWSARCAVKMNFSSQPEISHTAELIPWWKNLLCLGRYASLNLVPHSPHSILVLCVSMWLLSLSYTKNSESQPSTLHFSFGYPWAIRMWSATPDFRENLWSQSITTQGIGFSPPWAILLCESMYVLMTNFPHSSHSIRDLPMACFFCPFLIAESLRCNALHLPLFSTSTFSISTKHPLISCLLLLAPFSVITWWSLGSSTSTCSDLNSARLVWWILEELNKKTGVLSGRVGLQSLKEVWEPGEGAGLSGP